MTASRISPEPDVYDLAFLAGGPARVVDTAVVALLRTGRLRLHSPGRLATADPARRHAIEAAVLDAVGPMGSRSVDTVRWCVMDDERLVDVGRRMRRRGLMGRAAGALAVLHGDRRALAPTRAGRRVLPGVGDDVGAGDAEVWQVALGGRDQLPDQRMRGELFDPPGTTPEPATAGGQWARHLGGGIDGRL